MLGCSTHKNHTVTPPPSRFVVRETMADQVIQEHRWSWDLRPFVEATQAELDDVRTRLQNARDELIALRREYARACRFIDMHAAADPDGVRERLEATEVSIQHLTSLASKRAITVAKLNGALEAAVEREYHQMRPRLMRVRVRPV